MPWFAWFLLGAVLGGSIGCLAAALAFTAGKSERLSHEDVVRMVKRGTIPGERL